MRIISAIGARPNFIKIAPIAEALQKIPNVTHYIVHTGQHYDQKMSDIFFRDLGIPTPDIDLKVGSGSHAVQTAEIMIAFEKVCKAERPDIVIVVGDVNSTMACAIVAAKLLIPVAHIEAGLRSFDKEMPEEINRILTDAVSEYLFTHSRNASKNLKMEGIPETKIHFVGNVMIDPLLKHRKKAESLDFSSSFGVVRRNYVVLTLHRPSNVDDAIVLKGILESVRTISKNIPVIFPVHPRTRERIHQFGLTSLLQNGVQICEPTGYLEFLNLMCGARFVLTDSGGIQEETTILGIPCLTIRKNTERPVTITDGTNVLVGVNPVRIIKEAQNIMDTDSKQDKIPELWDGKAAERIAGILTNK